MLEIFLAGRVTSSTQRFTWHILINRFVHKIEVIHSSFTGRRQVILDHKEVHDTGRYIHIFLIICI